MEPTQISTQKQGSKKSCWKWFFVTIGGCGFLLLMCGLCLYITGMSYGKFPLETPTTSYTTEIIQGHGEDKVAVIDINGVIIDFPQGPSLFDINAISSEEVNRMIDFAVSNKKVKAILFRLNTPGGTLTAAETICKKIKEVREKDIYTLAWIHTQGTSGGYYIASCTDWIVARKDSITGSIGISIEAIDAYAFLEKLGFRVRTITNTKGIQKTGEDIFREGSETEKIYRAILDEGFNQFIDTIEEGRRGKEKSLTRDEILALSDGRIYSGKQAFENGLVDELGYEKDAINTIIDKADLSEDATIELIKPEVNFWNMLTSQAISKILKIEITDQFSGLKLMAIMNTD